MSLRSSTILYFSADSLNCAKFPSLKCAHNFLWLNPTGHSKFHNTSNHPPPATDSGRTARTPLYSSVQAVPPYSLSLFFLFRTGEPAKAGTCARDRRALQQLALNVHVNHSDLTWPDLTWSNSNCSTHGVTSVRVHRREEGPPRAFFVGSLV